MKSIQLKSRSMKKAGLLAVALSVSALSVTTSAALRDDSWFTTGGVVDIDVDPTSQGDIYSWEGEWLVGSDFNKLAVKTEGERLDGETDDANVQLLYSRNFAKYWDWRLGVKQDVDPKAKTYGVLAIAGLAPYYFDVEGSLYVNGSGISSEINLAYELQVTQKLVVELYNNSTWNSFVDHETDTGKGLSFLESGSQIRYEFNRHFALYVDIYNQHNVGDTADMMDIAGESTSRNGVRFGVRLFNF